MSYALRVNQTAIYRSFLQPYVTAVLGPRRVGKSTLVQEFAQTHQQGTWVFLNMDDLEERQRSEKGELKILIEEKARRAIGTGDIKIWVAISDCYYIIRISVRKTYCYLSAATPFANGLFT